MKLSLRIDDVQESGYTQEQIATHLNMHYSYISLLLRTLKST